MAQNSKLSEYQTKLVSGIILDKNRVLLGLRRNTQYFSGSWSLPVGHVENGELLPVALKRELNEELGIKVIQEEVFCIKTDRENSIFHQVFIINEFRGRINNLEPQYCKEVRWCELEELPEPLTPITREILLDFNRKLATC
jgi:mutator protein MutT